MTSFYSGHPTLQFLLPTSKPYKTLATTDQLPLEIAAGKSALLVMSPQSHAQYDAAKYLYPNAQFEEVMPPMAGPPVLYTVRLSPEDVASIQGLDGRYFGNGEWQGEPALVKRNGALTFDWATAPPLAEPFSVEWNGVLHVADYGAHDLVLESPGQAELYIGEQQVLSGTGVLSGSLTLAEGNHALRVRAQGAPGRFELRWRAPDKPLEVMGTGALYAAPLAANGLLARYFANGDWQGPEAQGRASRPRWVIMYRCRRFRAPIRSSIRGKLPYRRQAIIALGWSRSTSRCCTSTSRKWCGLRSRINMRRAGWR